MSAYYNFVRLFFFSAAGAAGGGGGPPSTSLAASVVVVVAFFLPPFTFLLPSFRSSSPPTSLLSTGCASPSLSFFSFRFGGLGGVCRLSGSLALQTDQKCP